MEELYENLCSVTIIPNDFLINYLSDTKSEYIKVFLFYLWKGAKEKYSIEETSNEIDLDENVVEMALKFWIKKKMMKNECLTWKGHAKSNIKSEANNLLNFQDKKQELIKKNRKEFVEIESNLLFVAEKLLGQTLSERQINLIAKCYNEYGFDEGLIQYLLEYCSGKSQTNVKYMSSVADSWYEQGIKDASAAKAFTDTFEKKSGKTTNIKNNNTKTFDRPTGYYSDMIKM